MQVKIDTKEKFHVITPIETTLSATMADEMKQLLLSYLELDVKNVVFDLSNISTIDRTATEALFRIQQDFYENKASFVTCSFNKEIEDFWETNDFSELLNLAPTQSEASDIVQMEEIERELMDDDILE